MTTIVTQSLFRCLDLIELKAHCDTKCWIICQCCLRRSAIANTVKETLPQTSFSFFLSFFWPCKIWVGNLNFLSELLVTTFLKCVSKKKGGGGLFISFFRNSTRRFHRNVQTKSLLHTLSISSLNENSKLSVWPGVFEEKSNPGRLGWAILRDVAFPGECDV